MKVGGFAMPELTKLTWLRPEKRILEAQLHNGVFAASYVPSAAVLQGSRVQPGSGPHGETPLPPPHTAPARQGCHIPPMNVAQL